MPHTFVLVHGAWHGGWCWRRVADRLEANGHKVYAPSLAGLADRSHVLRPDINLTTHALDVANLVKWERLENVVLVGHSYGGMVVTAAAEHVGPAIASIVFLDAFCPDGGQSMLDVSARSRAMVEAARASGRSTVPPIPAATFKVNSADAAWVDAQCTPHPLETFTEPVSAAAVTARDAIPRKAYIRATATDSPWFDAALAKARSSPAWRTYEVPCGHDVMVDMPDRLVEILLDVASG